MAGTRRTSNAERDARNRGLQEAESRQRDPDQRTPHKAAEQESPEQERLTTPDEEQNQDIAQMENPPQAEGPRERNNDAV